ncbi:hypothetical protein IFM89_015115 [Coptis chinensis]|uniref:Uncharacterized protein n=1 Tax=Coptis chinensis TaxID=261450 RepID=A0A835MBG3_9MAGN|nr:hypothetical protein IFM89_015115 [Coptis chinensis]
MSTASQQQEEQLEQQQRNKQLRSSPVLVQNHQSDVPCILDFSFNQSYECLVAGTDRGFRIYDCSRANPVELRGRVFEKGKDCGGGLGVVEKLFPTSIYALVGGGSHPQYPPNKVMIWDDRLGRCTGELAFKSSEVVRAVRLHRELAFVVFERKILVFDFFKFKLLYQFETTANPKGLCEVSDVSASFVLVSPGLKKGQARVEHYDATSSITRTISKWFISAHDSTIACFALSMDGKLLATASAKGTLVRIFNASNGILLQEVRRGTDRAEIYCIAFSPDVRWLAVSSDKGTVHVFSLNVIDNSLCSASQDINLSASSNPSLVSRYFMKGLLPGYFCSEWSLAQFRSLHKGVQYLVAFGGKMHTILIFGIDGSFCQCQFDPMTGGEMTQLECSNFLTAKQDQDF